jgi:hypothetical protein
MNLDAAQISKIRAQVGRFPRAAVIAREVLAQAERIHCEPILAIEFEPGRNVTLPTSRKLFNRVTTLGIAGVLDGQSKHRVRAVRELLAASNFDSWNPDHFLDTAEMMTAVSIGLKWFGHFMSSSEKQAVEIAIVEKGITPGAAKIEAGAYWLRVKTNWNVVCCGGLIVASLAVRHVEPDLCRKVLTSAQMSFSKGILGFEPDGGYPEGPGYWEYALRYAILAFDALKTAGLEQALSPGFLDAWRYGWATTGPSGAVFNIGDTADRPDRSPMLGWLAIMSKHPRAAVWQHHAPGEPHALDLLWFAPPPPPGDIPEVDAATVFEGAGVGILARPDDHIRVLLKGGRNDSNHSHLDLGSVMLDVRAVRFIDDPGREDYASAGYFDPTRRFTYRRTKTSSHSTIHAVGFEQSPDARAIDLRHCPTDRGAALTCFIQDPASPVLHSRAVAFGHSRQVFIIDAISPKVEGTPIDVQWQIITRARVAIEGNRVKLHRDGVDLCMESLEPANVSWFAEVLPSAPNQADNSAFTRLGFSLSIASPVTLSVRLRLPEDASELAPSLPPDWTRWGDVARHQ